MRSPRVTHNLLAVSADVYESAVNTYGTANLSLIVDTGDIVDLEPRKETNAEEAIGKEEATKVYSNGYMASLSLSFNKAMPQHFALLAAYGLGTCTTSAAGTGYEHVCTPIDGDLDSERSNPTLTVIQRLGDSIAKRRFASFAVDGFTASFNKDDWVKITGSLKGTGKYEDNVTEESITANDDDTTLTLAANAVQGSTAQERLDSVHAIRVELESGEWTDVEYSAVSDATPAVITISAPGSSTTSVTYKVLYVPDEAAWCTFPSTVDETPLRVSQMNFYIGGTWDGTDFQGGRTISNECNAVEHDFSNSIEAEFVPGAGGDYAATIYRPQREQSLKVERKFLDYILQNYMIQDEYFGARILAEGAVYDSPHKYQVEIIFPRLAIMKAGIGADGKRLSESAEIQVLEDDTYGSVIYKIKNLQTKYAAAS
jgi:hypothetical protein